MLIVRHRAGTTLAALVIGASSLYGHFVNGAAVDEAAGSSEPVNEAITRLEDLGPLPFEVNWPVPPKIVREVVVNSMDDYAQHANAMGTRFLIKESLPEQLAIQANDVEVLMDASVHVPHITIGAGLRRIRVAGGVTGTVAIPVPGRWDDGLGRHVFDPERIVEDVVFDGIRVRTAPPPKDTRKASGTTAFSIRGRRIAVLNCEVDSGTYGVWCSFGVAPRDVPCEDIIVAGCTFRAAGPEATVRFVGARRGVVVANVLYNPIKHNYRIHGISDLHYAARNTLNGGGVMIGDNKTDQVGRVWFNDNVLNNTTAGFFNLKASLDQITAHNNVTISVQRGQSGRFTPGRAKSADIEGNKVSGGSIADDIMNVLDGLRSLPKE